MTVTTEQGEPMEGCTVKERSQRDDRLGRPIRPTIDKARRQRRVITNAAVALTGITGVLEQIEALHPDITSAEAAQWVDDLSDSRRAINALIKQLKERTNV